MKVTTMHSGMLHERAKRLSEVAQLRHDELQKMAESFGPTPNTQQQQHLLQRQALYLNDAQDAVAAVVLSNLAAENISDG